MAYSAPSVGVQGLTVPTYADILQDLIAQFQSVYGSTVYLGNDSPDYQFLSILALKMSDTMQAVQLAYNNRSPLTAIGSGLDGLVKLNGIARKVPSFSACQVTVSGTAGTVIVNGVVQDAAGYKWDLPSPLTIGAGGVVTATAVCETVGAIQADVNTITTIVTPTAGWVSATNSVAAVMGTAVENDYSLRARQAISVALSSKTMLSGTVAAIAAVSGVTRYNIFENPTGSTDSFGTPAHSITCVVEGGTDEDIATAIYNNRGIGCYTNGTSSFTVTDPLTNGTMSIGFYRPSYKAIYAALNVKALAGYTSATTTAIQNAVAAYLNSLQIGEMLSLSAAQAAAMAVNPNLSTPLFSIRGFAADITASPTATSDIVQSFNEVTSGDVSRVTVTLV